MSSNLVTYAFVAGEISPTLFARTDLEKYDLGLETALNFFIDYRGGVSTRPGTEFVDFIEDDDQPIKAIPFKFAPNLANTYVILFFSSGVRFIQDGAYVLEADVTITDITQASPGVVTASSHGFSTGDWVKISGVAGMTEINGRTLRVGSTTTNTFELQDPLTETDFDTSGFTAYSSGGVVARIYTISHPYSTSDFTDLRAHQIRDTVRLTHPDYQIRNLTRSGETSWAISTEAFTSGIEAPDQPSASASGTGSADVLLGVTAVNAAGEESELSDLLLETNIVNYTSTAGFLDLSWNTVADAVSYNVYRSRIADTELTFGEELGYIGSAFGPRFTDNNIIPDFATTAPEFNDPFAVQAVSKITITNAGSGYNEEDTIDVTDSTGSGSGFRGVLIVSPSGRSGAGEIVGIRILNGGSDYETPVVSITTSGGSGATFDVETTPASGTFPSISTVFQQRQVYAATSNSPLGIWGSRPGRLSNFDVSRVLTDGDAFAFELDSDVVSPIRHLVPSRLGLLAMTQSGIWLLSGGEERALTPLNGVADPQTSTGVSETLPIAMDTDILYLEDKGRTARLLGYDELQKAFAGKDVSILANHLFIPTNQVTHWAFAPSPYSLIWARREDGTFLSFTFEKEQNVFAWTQHKTRGLVEDLLVVEEGILDSVYLVVKRKVNGRWTKFIERLASREFDNVEDAWCVDCGLTTLGDTPAASLTPGAISGTTTFTASAGVFSAGNVGDVLRVGCGRATITTFTSSTVVEAELDLDITEVIPGTEIPLEVEAGDWTITTPFGSVRGLDHLEGETVKVLLDGNVLDDKVVTNGEVSFDGETGSKAIVGLGFQAIAKTLSPVATEVSIEASRKNVVGSAVRVKDTKGLKVGADLDHLYEVRQTTEEELIMQQGFQHILVASNWTDEGQTFYVQDNPLPATILGIVLDLEVGDDTA